MRNVAQTSNLLARRSDAPESILERLKAMPKTRYFMVNNAKYKCRLINYLQP
jgi:hypothetical protein